MKFEFLWPLLFKILLFDWLLKNALFPPAEGEACYGRRRAEKEIEKRKGEQGPAWRRREERTRRGGLVSTHFITQIIFRWSILVMLMILRIKEFIIFSVEQKYYFKAAKKKEYKFLQFWIFENRMVWLNRISIFYFWFLFIAVKVSFT